MKTIKAKLTFATTASMIMLSLALIVQAAIRTFINNEESIENRLITLSDSQAEKVKSSFEKAVIIAELTAKDIQNAYGVSAEVDRDYITEKLSTFTDIDNSVLYIGTHWKDNAFDTLDGVLGHFSKGIIKTDKEKRQFDLGNVLSQNEIELGFASKTPVVTASMSRLIGQNQIHSANVIVPIVINGDVKGINVIGLDIDRLQRDLASQSIFNETGTISIFSDQGSICASSAGDTLIGKNLESAFALYSKSLDYKSIEKTSAETIGDDFVITHPIKFAHTNQTWFVKIDVPAGEIQSATIGIVWELVLGSMIFMVFAQVGIYFFTKSFSQPIEKIRDYAKSVSEGNVNIKCDYTGKDELGALAEAFRNLMYIQNELIEETKALTFAAEQGDLQKRGDVAKYPGAFGDMIDGFNRTLDALVTPLNTAAGYVAKIAEGNMPPRINEKYNGDFNELKNNINMLIDNLNTYSKDVEQFIYEHRVNGDIDFFIDEDKYKGFYQAMAHNSNDAVRIYINNIKKILAILGAYGKGNMKPTLKPLPGKQAIANENLDRMKANILEMANDLQALIDGAQAGKLDVRGDEDKYEGAFRQLVGGFNKTLDAVTTPINISAQYIDRISKGDIPKPIQEDFNGDFNEIKKNINGLINNLSTFIAEMQFMSEEQAKGEIDIFINEDKFAGAYKAMAMGVNSTVKDHVDVLMRILDILSEYANGNFTEELEDLPGKRIIATERTNELRTNLTNIHNEIADLIEAAHEGELDTRGNEEIFTGGWKELIIGINQMFVGMTQPINECLHILESISNNDFTVKINRQYSGKWKQLQTSIENTVGKLERILGLAIEISNGNLSQLDKLKEKGKFSEQDELTPAFIKMMDSIRALVNDVQILSDAAISGNFAVRADVEKHSGDFANVILGVNSTIDAFTDQFNTTLDFLNKVSKGQELAKLNLDDSKGEYRNLAEYINILADFIQNLIDDTAGAAQKAIEGDLKQRINTSGYPGRWNDIVSGINQTLDAVVEPIEEAGEVLQIMASGDMTARMVGNYMGDHEKLKDNINSLGDSLSELLAQLNDVVVAVANASNDISHASESVATSSQEQSTQVEEIASAIEEMSMTITENSSNANKTANFADNNGKIAKDGGQVVVQTIEKMKEIAKVVQQSALNIEKLGKSSTEIGAIISVIEEIADQTNLLALNAAIEAARAGEQGRGFAVVADEVRKLAERTTDATKQISYMINSIQKETEAAVQVMQKGNEEVQHGITLADNAGDALNRVVQSSEDVLDMVNSIASSSEQQAATGEQLAKNVTAISEVAVSSAKNIESIARSSETLTEMTDNLQRVMKKFKIDKKIAEGKVFIDSRERQSLPPSSKWES
jgi:methyl-accepting chemotaxis protein